MRKNPRSGVAILERFSPGPNGSEVGRQIASALEDHEKSDLDPIPIKIIYPSMILDQDQILI